MSQNQTNDSFTKMIMDWVNHPMRKNIQDDQWQNLFLGQTWTILETPFSTPVLYQDLIGQLTDRKAILITEDIKLLGFLFESDIKEGLIKILSDVDSYSFDLSERKEAIFIVSFLFPDLGRFLKKNLFEMIIIDLPRFSMPIKDSKLYPILKEVHALNRTLLLISPSRYVQSIKRDFSKFALTFSHPLCLDDISFKVLMVENEKEKLLHVTDLISKQSDKGIIFVARREEGELLEAFLSNEGISIYYMRKELKACEKTYLEKRFNHENNFDPLQLIIISDLTQFNLIPSTIKWVMHYNFASGWNDFLKEIVWCSTKGKKLISYLFYSYRDKLLKESQIKYNSPDPKSLRLVYSYLRDSYRWGNTIFINIEHLFSNLRLPNQKLKMTLELLEKKKIIQKDQPVISHAKILFDSSFIQNHIFYPNSLKKLSLIRCSEKYIDLLTYCKRESISPILLTKNLLGLEKQGKCLFLQREIAHTYVLDKENKPKLKLNFDEIKKIIPLEPYYSSLKRLEAFVHDYPVSRRRSLININLSDPNNPPTLTDWINLVILHLALESPFVIGKYLMSQILTGSRSKKIIKLKLDQLSMYNAFSLIKPDKIRKLIMNLLVENFLEEVFLKEPILKGIRLSKKGDGLLKKEIGLKNLFWKHHKQHFSNHKESIYPLLKRILACNNAESLKENTLRSIALFKPKTIDELNMIKGINKKNIEQLSFAILSTIQKKDPLPKKQIDNSLYLEKIDTFLNKEYSPKLKGDFTTGYSLSCYTLVSEGRNRYTPLGKAVHDYKYKNKQGLPNMITLKALSFLKKEQKFAEVDMITCVPPHTKFPSIAKALGEWLSQAINIPFYNDLLLKIGECSSQKSIETLDGKLNNVKKLFIVSKPHRVKNCSILLLDDIYDSGATVNSCSQVFKENGATKIFVLTCTKTSYRDN